MLANITGSIVELLNGAGIKAGRAYPKEDIVREGGCFVRAKIESVKQSSPAFAGYLGAESDPEGNKREIYGVKCDVALALDIYAGHEHGAAEECEAMVDDIIFALGSRSGLSIGSMSCKGVRVDGDTGLLLCPCSAEVSLLLTLPSEEDNARFSDFILKGEIKK